jgi:ankyrin repeat protein
VPKQFTTLDQIIVTNPCRADWDSMKGNDQVRFCEHCSLSVNNLSSMTRYEAMRLVAQSRGRLCARFIQSPGRSILAKTPDKLYRIGRTASRIAAGAFTATLSLSAAAAQTSSRSQIEAVQPAIVNPASSRERPASLSGVITDPSGAIIAGASVTLVNMQTRAAFDYTTSNDGAYKFSLLQPGRYLLNAEASSFAKAQTRQLTLNGEDILTENIELQIPELTEQVEINSRGVEVQATVTMGVVAFRAPEEPLVKAAFHNDPVEVARLALAGSDVNVIDKTTDRSALGYAAENGNRDMIHVLISAGANPNGTNTRGETPLMYLHDNLTLDVLRDLLAAGADINARDEAGSTALMNLAASAGFEVVKQLLDAGAKIDIRDNDGNTLMMGAAQNEDPQFLLHLIKAGLSVNAQNDDGQTPLTMAARSGKAESLKILLDAGAGLNLQPKDLNIALILTLRNEDPGLAIILLKAGADANSRDVEGATALMLAAHHYPGNVKALIDAGAELNAKDDDGWTALMHADDLAVVRMLVNAGADTSIKNKDGETVLGMARRYEQADVVKFLESRGAP